MAVKGHLDNNTQSIEQREGVRRRLLLETSGSLPSGEASNVVIHNVSATGMLIETTLDLAEGEVIEVELLEAGPVPARIVWASGILFGCAFRDVLSDPALSAIALKASAPLPPELGRPASQRKATGELFGQRIEKLRKGRSMTLAQVADQLGVSKPTVWAWEKGKARPVADRIPALAEALGVAEKELSSFSEPPGIGDLIESSRQRIAEAYGTTPDKVRIMIEV
ncbi:Transcriptional regulator, contains XRE-family HTH domain [Altererythrobacter xiamenensis]|uniref:Transcriptional regulator, contains XRE-family HTH domain n=1 Tax=Altererythrobacter xiamenensis TaxID=1316679 RepID=A0A1Y6F766_9SPHN|nr:helix-turn-helix domain-containing protein [Altererythrobacter xiamenensis]SMQ69381.1 Transcriptional regulator, contains XRE-family HTH domain [Altererythrobacter xiamenensis]